MRVAVARHNANALALQTLVNNGSPRVVRTNITPKTKRKFPLPSIGDRSGCLTVTGYLKNKSRGCGTLIVQCDCGRPEHTVLVGNFRKRLSTRCDVCTKSDVSSGMRKRNWNYAKILPEKRHRARLLSRLGNAIARCHNSKQARFVHYGKRGISVCEAWRNDHAEFLAYVQTVPGWDNPSLQMDRINVNGNYEPGNIRFVTHSANAANRRKVSELEVKISQLQRQIYGPDQ